MSRYLDDLRSGRFMKSFSPNVYPTVFGGCVRNDPSNLIADLHKGAVTVEFIKVNGEHRVMVCTLNPKLITEAQVSDPALMPELNAFDENGKNKDFSIRKNPDV